MTNNGLTERRMSNKRFYKKEHAIFIAICSCRDFPTVRKLAKMAHVSRSTLYRHHQKIHQIFQDYEEYLLKAYTRITKKFLAKKADYRILVLRTLIFIYNNRETFKELFGHNRKEVVKQMFKLLEPSVVDEWHLAGDLAKMYNVYINEILGIIEAWAAKGFPKDSIEQVLDDILYLTDNARQNLLPIKD